MRSELQKYFLPLGVFLFTFILLSIVQIIFHDKPIILLERFISGGGWVEIPFIAAYGAFVIYKMQEVQNVVKWRRITWTVFSVVFFTQLIIGLLANEKFLMTGKLHLPIPALILAGPLYRGQLSAMTFLFLSTIILTGPAWCSHLCYFGAFDNLAASKRGKVKSFRYKTEIKATMLLIVIFTTLILRWFKVPLIYAVIFASSFGIAGILIMFLFSRRKRKMVHCTIYCPIGTLVNIMRFINPFRLYIDDSCTSCMKCTIMCKYDALGVNNVINRKPAYNCTLCGDCLASCEHNSLNYKFLNLKPKASRNLYLFITISMHAVFLALARI